MIINNRLAQGLLFGVIPTLWVLDGVGVLNLSEVIIGGTIAAWVTVIQFYFRKRPNEGKS